MRISSLLPALLAASGVAAAKGKFGAGKGAAKGSAVASNAGAGAATASAATPAGTAVGGGSAAAGNTTSNAATGNGNTGGTTNAGGVTTGSGNTPPNQLGVAGGQAGGALNAGANGPTGPNGLPQLANGQAGFDATTNTGTFGPFTPVSQALAVATGAPTTVDASTAQALQAAADNWSFDTSQVSNFLNTGKSLTGNTFNQGANIAYNAEVDELTHKAILDSVIGNDPDVSIANQTLTNGVFQSVVNNLQIMADQGANTQQLIDFISAVRCTQILPSIDTYLAVAARVVGTGATLRTAIRPDTCQGIVAAAPDSAFPGGIQVLNVRNNAGQTTQNAPQPNPNQGQVTGATGATGGGAAAGGNTGATGGGAAAGGNTGTTGTTGTGKGGKGTGAAASAVTSAATGAAPTTGATTGTTGAGAATGGKTGKAAGGKATGGKAGATKGKNKARRALPFLA